MKKIILTLLFLTLIIAIIQPARGCVQQRVQTANPTQNTLISTTLGTLTSLEINQSALLEAENLQITFLDVVEDSRCPTEITCVQAGQVKILFKISRNGQTIATLNLVSQVSQEDLAIATVEGYQIRLTNVEPSPHNTNPINLSDYRVTLVISQV